ncbi:MAG: hypothetical protein ACK4YP_06035 [Myxococcota bacterium]
MLLALLLACAGADPDGADPADTSPVDTGDTGRTAPEACLAARAFPLVVEAFDFDGEPRGRGPGYLRTQVARSEEELRAWLAAEIGGPPTTGSVDWGTEVALIGWLDANAARPDAFELFRAEGIGGDTLSTTWCVTWPAEAADSFSRTVRVYALPAGAYTTVTDTREWWKTAP